MKITEKLTDLIDQPVTAGVTVDSEMPPFWEDGTVGTPEVELAHVGHGWWRITVTDVFPAKTAMVTLAFDRGDGSTTKPGFRVGSVLSEGAVVAPPRTANVQ